MSGSLRAARVANSTFFGLSGFVLGVWVVHIPVVAHRAGVGYVLLGWLLLLLGAGAFTGMRLAGPLTDRFGTRRAVPASAILCFGALILPGLATRPWQLAGALLVLGFGNGCLDVTMNTDGVQVERAYRRPVMSGFHAAFSLGGLLAALVGARTLSWGWSPPLTFGIVSLLSLAITAVIARYLIRPEALERLGPAAVPLAESAAPRAGAERAGARDPSGQLVSRRIWGLAAAALLLMLAEGVAYDWSVIDLREVLGAPAAVAALGYGAFAVSMTTGRLLGDRVAVRVGPVAVVRYGAILAAVALSTVALSPWWGLAMAGWAAFGIGMSGCAPQLFGAAGHADYSNSGANVSRVAGFGYLGILAGPAVIGPMTRLMPLNLAFFLPVGCCVVAAGFASILRSRSQAAAATAPSAAPI